jgi:hypothetical protein
LTDADDWVSLAVGRRTTGLPASGESAEGGEKGIE